MINSMLIIILIKDFYVFIISFIKDYLNIVNDTI